jgi:hypothetical protein
MRKKFKKNYTPKGRSTSTKSFKLKNQKFQFLFIFHYITLQWVLGLVIKIYKYFNKLIPPYTWSIAKTWLNILVDDLEKHHKFEKKN